MEHFFELFRHYMEAMLVFLTAVGTIAAVFKYYWDDIHETASWRTGFLAEVEHLLGVVLAHRTWFGDGKSQTLVPFTTDFYDRQIANVGKLRDTKLAVKIVGFYGFVKFMNQAQAMRPGYLAASDAKGFNAFYKELLDRFADRFGTLFDDDFRRYGIKRYDVGTAKPSRAVKRRVMTRKRRGSI